MNQKISRLFFVIKQDAGLYLGISLGIFLFILFFQPFSSGPFNFNNWLLFIAGIAAIIYFFMVFVRIILRWIVSDQQQIYDEPFIHPGIEEFLIWSLSSAGLSFYLRYVGSFTISFYLIFKVALICAFPPVIVRIYDRFHLLRQQNEQLQDEMESYRQKVTGYEEDSLNKSVEFASYRNDEKLVMQPADIIAVKSADNYVVIICLEGSETRKKIIRSTLKNIESQLKAFPDFVRCHRTAIINRKHILRSRKQFNNYFLSMNYYGEEIPVSRQYLLQIKDLL